MSLPSGPSCPQFRLTNITEPHQNFNESSAPDSAQIVSVEGGSFGHQCNQALKKTVFSLRAT